MYSLIPLYFSLLLTLSISLSSPSPKSDFQVLSSEHFSVKFTGDAEPNEITSLLELLESIRASYQKRTGQVPDKTTEVIVHPSTKAFTQAAGRPWWVAAVTGEVIEIQPLRTLKSRGILSPTLRHEYAHVIIKAVSQKEIPLWLAEGFSIYLSGEGERWRPPVDHEIHEIHEMAKVSEQKLNDILRNPAARDQMQAAYYLAYQRVKKIISKQGEERIWNLLRQK